MQITIKRKIETLIVVGSSRASVSIVFSVRSVVSCAGSSPVVRVASVRKHSGSEPTCGFKSSDEEVPLQASSWHCYWWDYIWESRYNQSCTVYFYSTYFF